MRLSPTIPIFALAVVMWTTVLWTMRQRRARLAAYPSPQLLRSHRLHTVAAVTNGLLRQYFPHRMELTPVTQRQLDAVAKRLNTRPRQTLDWKTPAEVLAATVAATG